MSEGEDTPPAMSPPSLSFSLSFSAALTRRRANTLDLLRGGASLHALAIKLGASRGNFAGNSIVTFYSRCGLPSAAVLAFDDVEDKDVGSWNSLINGLSRHCSTSRLALSFFHRMRTHATPRMAPNSFTIAGVLTAVSALGAGGREAHAVAVRSGCCMDVFVGSASVNMYCKLGRLEDARKVFDGMLVRNVVTWATMISAYSAEGCYTEALEMFKLMLAGGEEGVNEFVVTGVDSAFVAGEAPVEMGEQVHCYTIKSGLLSFVPVRNSLITMYAKCGCLDGALEMFESSVEKGSITWSAMVTGYAQNGRALEALRMFLRMHTSAATPSEYTFVGMLNACSDCAALLEGKQAHAYLLKLGYESQTYIKSAFVDMYAKCGSMADARKGFDQISDPDVIVWTAAISGYVQNGGNEEALSLYTRMRVVGLPPNDLTLASVLRACSCLALLEAGKQVHAEVVKFGHVLETLVGSALLTMYARCGDLDSSHLVFKGMPTRDLVAWNSIIVGLTQNGCGMDALKLYDEMKMEGVKPDRVTLIGLLSACSHLGLVGRGWGYFRSMIEDYGLIPCMDHYASMVDILGRAQLLEEAKLLAESACIPNAACLWRIILGASANYRQFDVGAYAGEKLLQLGTLDPSAYVLLSNIYAASGRTEQMERVRGTMKSRGVSKEPGCSWIELDNRIHSFLVRDQSHPEVRCIYAALRRLNRNMRDEGCHIGFATCSHASSVKAEEINDENASQQLHF